MRRLVAIACLVFVPAVALATIYKVQMPDGTILFTDAPPPGGKILEERASKSSPRPPAKAPAAPPSAGAPIPVLPSPSPRAAAAPGASAAIPRNLDAANAEVVSAERELAVLQRKLEAGREPLPGERLGTAKGGSRLSPEYESRIASLEREVAAAEARVKRAYEMRNALR